MRKRIGKVMAVMLSMSMVVGSVYVMGEKSEPVKAAQQYQLVWSDEFNGNALDTNIWSYEIGNGDWGWGNGEVEYYTDRKENVEVKDGTLQIHALKENYGGQEYTSGRIITKGKKSFKYGKMEARIKVENGNQNGVWPAFWMMGENINQVGWPKCGEIDIMEHANSNNKVGGCLHWNNNGLDGAYEPASFGSGDRGAANAFGYFTDNVNNGINGWHTYGLVWDEKHMEWQLDGVTYLRQNFTTKNAYCFQKEQFFLLNLAIGGPQTGYTGCITANPNTYQTATMYVDYLRVYDLKEVPDTTQNLGNTQSTNGDTVTAQTSKPGTTKIVTAKRSKSKKSITIKLRKVKNVKGYQVRYSTSSKFKSYQNKKTSKQSVTLKGLNAKKKYYIKARAYVLDANGKKVYGKFCKVKKVKK